MEDYRLKQLIEEQLKYDKGNNRRNDHFEDHEIAKVLQEQFNHEVTAEKASNLVYETKKKSKNVDSTKSLVDPSWELVDPTPNIFNLFVAFNQQFFWNKLLAVCVSWSKRMTTCAGICSYQGRAGLCSITLSEPLLKLRPRKDLVETLLHEMIHAYLFVTNNNRDRDGHGPEFHKHMYRINGEAGTNITVYHSFHDEVRLYQQHWWKCNGPCQTRKPFFGMVRRATNRAPSKNDRWWAEHTATCGGTFIKVKEPEKIAKGTKKAEKENSKPKSTKSNVNKVKSPPAGDIRNFFPVIGHTSPGVSPIVGPGAKNGNKLRDNTKIGNINGFKSGESGSLELKNAHFETSTPKPVELFQGSGQVLASINVTESPDYSAVRNHWLDKFDNKRKEPASSHTKQSPKRLKSDDMAHCPICNLMLPSQDVNDHLDNCLQTASASGSQAPVKTNLIECDICSEFIAAKELEAHKAFCLQNISVNLNSSVSIECPICKAALSENLYDMHVASCFMKGFDDALKHTNDDDHAKVQCLVCKRMISKSLLNRHLDDCMTDDIFVSERDKDAFFEDDSLMEEYNKSVVMSNDTSVQETIVIEDDHDTVACPVCQKRIAPKLINVHLDNCLA